MKTLITLLLLIPRLSWGHESTATPLIVYMEYCSENPEYDKWRTKNKKTLDKRKVHFHKCILEHAKEGSSLREEVIMRACSVVSNDKYKTKGENPGQYQHTFTLEYGSSGICHKH